MTPQIIAHEEISRIRSATETHPNRQLEVLADVCRANTLSAIKLAGSGHIGSSLSALDIVVLLYNRIMNTIHVGYEDPNRDVFFSSKGHDVPGLYSVLHSVGVIPDAKLGRLRRQGGLDGHPDISTLGIEANSGSLGMGVSKGKGIAWAKRFWGHGGDVFVLTGDGELQEGQNYEAFQSAVHLGLGNLHVIVDHNKVQSDKSVSEIIDLGSLEDKLSAFGWHVERCDGHDFAALHKVFETFRTQTARPKILIADTIKGRGVSFMEHPVALSQGDGIYAWHSGAPDDAVFLDAWSEVFSRLNGRLRELGITPVELAIEGGFATASPPPISPGESSRLPATPQGNGGKSPESVGDAFGSELIRIAGQREDVVVLDGDLAADCRVRAFEEKYPHRFIENGIAEQDMVSTAGGLARHGLLPVVNSFASFLVSRANEQIYNNATEHTKIIYACHYAGLLPAAPGKSHQSLRDISLLRAIPNMIVAQPCTGQEARAILRYCINQATTSCAIRITIGPPPGPISLPADYRLQFGEGVRLTTGNDAVLFAYGSVMVYEALQAAEILARRGISLGIINLPWLNQVNLEWLVETVDSTTRVCVIEDHSPVGGLGDHILSLLVGSSWLAKGRFEIFGVEGYPTCGTAAEALEAHGLNGASLAQRIENIL